MDRHTALTRADFGWATAERDAMLSEVFVQTDLWLRVYAGQSDVVLGPKGSGKSAIYAQLLHVAKSLRGKRVHLIGAENPADDPIFNEMRNTRALEGHQFVGLWKLYFLTILASKLRDLRVRDRTLSAVIERLDGEGLLPPPEQSALVDLFQRVLRYADAEFGFDSSATAIGPVVGQARVFGTITLHEPTADRQRSDTVTVSHLMRQVASVLHKKRLTVWVLVDRLDTAFVSVSEEVEARALKALIQTYIDWASYQNLALKLFLRDDVWSRINTASGDRVAGANIIQASRIEWPVDRLLDMFCRRITHNDELCRLYDVRQRNVSRDDAAQRELAVRLLPKKDRWSFNSMLDLLRDGGGGVAPRELIRLMSEARTIQVARIERSIARFEGSELFEVATLESALHRVSEDRLFQVLIPEYPHLHVPVNQLRGGTSDRTLTDLARAWNMDAERAIRTANQLAALGFFGASGETGSYTIGQLYRPALSIR